MSTHVGLHPNLYLHGGLYSVLLMKAKTVVQYENLLCSYPSGVLLCHYHPETRVSMFLRNVGTHLETIFYRNR